MLSRRKFIGRSALAAAVATAGCSTVPSQPSDIIDCHTHFYDPTRPQGVPWPGKNETQLYRRVLPDDYKRLARPLGITGTVVIEASAWLEDNQWILDLAQDEPFIKGFVGHLNSGDAEFPRQLNRFSRHPLFRGIRVSGKDVNRLADPAKLRDLRLLADADLSLDVNGGVDSLPSVAVIARAVPSLRIIIDHVANVRIDGGTPPPDWLAGMREAGGCSNVFCKVSGLVEGSGQRNGQAPRDLNFYRPVLDHVWRHFGPGRVIYGSNWPVSELFADLATVHGLVKNYCGEKERETRNFFAGNARFAYKWRQR